jgi:hypothetical protein
VFYEFMIRGNTLGSYLLLDGTERLRFYAECNDDELLWFYLWGRELFEIATHVREID